MHVMVCYDVPVDGRRKRLFEGLKGYIEPVQKSVFEGVVTPRAYARMVSWIDGLIDHEKDNVRIYRLCASCVGHAEHLGKAFAVQTEPEDIVI